MANGASSLQTARGCDPRRSVPTDGPFLLPTSRPGERLVPIVYAEEQQTLNGKLAVWGGTRTHAKARKCAKSGVPTAAMRSRCSAASSNLICVILVFFGT